MSRHLLLTENGEPVKAALTETEAATLNAIGLAQATRTAQPGIWLLTPGRKVGTVQIGPSLQASVTPKVNIDRLMFMMGYARDPSFWRDEPVTVTTEQDLPEVLAVTFSRLAAAALATGLMQGYRTVDDSLYVVRGRIRADDQLRQRYQLPLPVEVRYDEFTTDIPENQILLAATLCLLRLPRIHPATRAGLNHLRFQLSDISAPRPGAPLPAWRPSRLNARYQPALKTAELILVAASFEQHRDENSADDIRVSGFLLDAWKIFEDFVCIALSESLAGRPGYARLQYPGRLDTAGAISIEPDFTWWEGTRAAAVVDAKYKVERSSRYPNADTYQVLAYCTALGLADGHLVYAQGETEPRRHQVEHSPITIHTHALDLAARPGELLAQVKNLAQDIAGGMGSRPPSAEQRTVGLSV